MNIEIARYWDGRAASLEALTRVSVGRVGDVLRVEIDAPFYNDPAPEGPPGEVWGLWAFEVVEVFLLGDGERYLEVEFGPWGHHLILSLEGRRNVVGRSAPVRFEVERGEGQWRGVAEVPWGLVPEGVRAFNAYAIHGVGEARRYLAAHPVPGASPDFHRLECFGVLEADWAVDGGFASG